MLPNFLGIGAPRCGTTWLARCLSEHPEVYMAPAKETNFLHWAEIEGKLDQWKAHFAGAESESAVGEFSVRYLASPRAAQRIAELVPEARLLVSLRDPAQQVYSHYWHLKRQNFHQHDPRDAPDTLDEALDGFAEFLLPPARYGADLERWLESVRREQLHFIFYDDIAARPDAVLRGVFEFLGVDARFVPPSLAARDSNVRRGTSPRSATAEAVHTRLYDSLNRFIYRPLKSLIGPRQADRIKSALRVRQVMEKTLRQRGYPPLGAAQRQRILEALGDQVSLVESLTGRDLSAWK